MDDPAAPSTSVSIDPPVARLDTALFGRSTLSDDIYSGRFTSSGTAEPARVHVLHGLGGSGKTHLALDIARRAQRAGRKVWWVPISQLTSGMREVAARLGAPDRDVDRAWAGMISARDLVWRHLNSSIRPWVLIFDNVDDPELLSSAGSHLADGTGWLRCPETSTGMVIVTTRDGRQSSWGSWSHLHAVQPLTAQDGGKLLFERATDAAGTIEEACELAAVLGGLPLALRAAGDYLRSVHTNRLFPGIDTPRTFNAYRDEVRRLRGPETARSTNLTEILGAQVVEEVFTLSLDLLHRRGLPEAAALVRVLATFDIAPVPYTQVLRPEVFAGSSLFSQPSQPLAMLQELSDLSLISLEIDGPKDDEYSYQLTLHPLIQAIARNDERTRPRWDQYQSFAIDLLLAATAELSPDIPSSAPAWHLLEPHVTEVALTYLTAEVKVARSVEAARKALELARRSMRYLIATRLLLPAQGLLTRMIDASRRHGFDSDSPEVLSLRHELARVALERNEFESAEQQLRAVIKARTRILGELHADTLASGHKLGRAIMGQHRWAEAEALLRDILVGEAQLAEHLRRPYDVEVVRHSLARAIGLQGKARAAEAEGHVRQALATLLTMREPNESEVLFCYDTIAHCLSDQGRLVEAEEAIVEALSATGPRDSEREQVQWLNNTLQAIRNERSDDPASILSSLRKSAADLHERLGEDHPEYVRAAEMVAEFESVSQGHGRRFESGVDHHHSALSLSGRRWRLGFSWLRRCHRWLAGLGVRR